MSSNNNFEKFQLYYRKPKNDNVLKNLEETHMGISNCQNFIPLYSTFFSLNGTNYNSINLNHQYSINSIVVESVERDGGDQEQHSKNYATVTVQQHTQVDEEKETNENSDAISSVTSDSCNYKNDVPVFFKFSPLLDPIKYLAGSYDMQNNSLLNLPLLMSSPLSIDNKNNKNKGEEKGKEAKEGKEEKEGQHHYCHPKILDPNNAAYVDGFFSYLSSQLLHAHDFIHGIDFYGAYLATQKDFTFNIFDDQEYLMKNDFFKDKNGVLFYYDEAECQNVLTWNQDRRGGHKETKSKNSKIQISNENAVEINAERLECIETCETYDGFNPNAIALDTELVDLSKSQLFNIHDEDTNENCDTNENDDIGINYKKCGDCDSHSSSSSSCSSRSSHTTNGSLYNMSDNNNDSISESDSYNEEEEEEEGDEGDDEDEEEEILNAIIYDFPVEVIALERCSKTLDHLMVKDTLSDEEWEAALMQIVLILATYQKVFAFTHNDLHTNNIMYIETDKKFIYYCFNKKYYKVPTFGRIFKIIDFGRSIYTFNSKLICSDSFHRSGDAATQYNCEPYFNDKKPLVEPNYSFDLCRLGCSLFDFFIDDIDNVISECKKSRLTKLVVDWITDDNGRNILYKKSGVDRYPDFKLYKMIARTVHDKVPSQQLLKHTVFTQYEITQKNIKKSFAILNIDGIPSYI